MKRLFTEQDIANALDLAVLKPTATASDVKGACAIANKHGIKSVCVPPIYVNLAAEWFDNVSTVISFPHGNQIPQLKCLSAFHAVNDGARELDVVINYGRFIDGDYGVVEEELQMLVNCMRATKYDIKVKAILETYYYTLPLIDTACKICVNAGVDFVKTSTGFATRGATVPTVQAMLNAVKGTGVQVKASGGIRNYTDAARYLEMGCTRLGSSRYHELVCRGNVDNGVDTC